MEKKSNSGQPQEPQVIENVVSKLRKSIADAPQASIPIPGAKVCMGEKANICRTPDDTPNDLQSKLLDMLMSKRITAQSNIAEPKTLVSMASNNAPILRQGSLCFVTGQAGCRKTTGLTLWCADMMMPGTIANSPFEIDKPLSVLYIDTEQAEYDTLRICKRVVSLIGTEERFNAYALISFEVKYIGWMVEELINKHRPNVVVIDNVAQMANGSIMDIDVAETLVRNLRRIAVAYNTALIGVIHMNEGSNSDRAKARGHIGSEIQREADLVFRFVADNDDYSVAQAIKARWLKPDKFAVAIDDNGVPYYHEVPEQPKLKPSDNPDKYAGIIAAIPDNGMAYYDIVDYIVSNCKNRKGENVSKPTAKSWIANMVKSDCISKIQNRYYKGSAKLHNENDNSLPF